MTDTETTHWSPPANNAEGPRFAGAAERFGATLLDMVMVGVVILVLALLLGVPVFSDDPASADDGSTAGWLILGVATLLGGVLYEIVALHLWGRTLGKLVLRLRVCMDTNTLAKPTLGRSTMRYVVKHLQPPLTILAVLMIFTIEIDPTSVLQALWYAVLISVISRHTTKQGWHDQVARTYVLKD